MWSNVLQEERVGITMLQSEKLKRVLDGLEDACGHCAICSPDCPIAISRRAINGLYYDVKQNEEYEAENGSGGESC